MACGSGCCGKSDPASAPSEQSKPVLTKRESAPMRDDCDSCCINTNLIAGEDPEKSSLASPAPDELAEPAEDDGCHTPAPAAPDCGDCCSPPKPPPLEAESVPNCCEGKVAPCCDQSCLDRLALRECRNYDLGLAPQSSTCGRGKDGMPCVDHAAKTRLTYAERLEALGCICPISVNKIIEISPSIARTTDLEKGYTETETERVILSISGMTCTGCETKLVRTLGTHPAVKNLKTSLVLSRAEFDVASSASLVEVLEYLGRTTEFKYERVTNKGSNFDIIVPDSDAAAFVNQPWPDGVTEVRVVDEETVNISFDPKSIGARDLVERGWGDGPIRLAAPRLDPALKAGSKHVRHVGYMTLLSVTLTIPVLVMAWAPLPERHLEYSSASLALATLVQVLVAGPFYPKALKALIFSRMIEMDLLVVLSTSAAYIFSVVSFGYMVSGQPLLTGQFFETSTLLVTLIMVGRWVSALARHKAVETISIRSLQSPTAIIVTDDGEREIDARLLQYGDVFKTVPDSRIPTDGTVISGSSEVDESMITGESRPVEKHPKSPVIAGSINGSGTLYVRLTRLPGDNTLSTIAEMVDEAKLSKTKIQNIADRVASYFVPVVVVITILTFSIWIAVGVKARNQTGSEATIQAITYAITVLIVSCPCAIGLATPTVAAVATGVAAARGVIFKSAESLELAYKASHVVFDKTGTITKGTMTVTQEWYNGSNQDATRSRVLGLVNGIKHPVSAAVEAHLKTQGVLPAQVSEPKTLTGKGVEGIVTESGSTIRAGNSRWLNLTSDPAVQSVLSQGLTAFCVTIDGSAAAIFGLEDSIRTDAASTVKALHDRGISVHVISGDDNGAVQSIAAQLNIPEPNVRSRCTPADKQAYIQRLLATSPNNTSKPKKTKKPVVIFCGDGTNDAIALAQATIGVHMNEGGTDVASSAADVVLMRPNLAGILTAIVVSRKSIHRIAFNFGWSFVYNLFAILLAAGAFVNARIPPEFAGLGELVSVLPVIAAAMQLRWSNV
ncbi:P-type cation-transporting ATPase [Madurella mycetomatis]|uniref:P-type cation-transporting ATPase n=1 Tax=Madurella mycetomatis TaxID=100816 RepID=A0A175W5Q1_9PEZI|nr:P-type cation-transporting ATPase [Madurella mycetomatis]KXX79577.1 P-type cation-transporting ATPase [Madurella mycetomatis]